MGVPHAPGSLGQGRQNRRTDTTGVPGAGGIQVGLARGRAWLGVSAGPQPPGSSAASGGAGWAGQTERGQDHGL